MDILVLCRRGNKIPKEGDTETKMEQSLRERPYRDYPIHGFIPYAVTKLRLY